MRTFAKYLVCLFAALALTAACGGGDDAGAADTGAEVVESDVPAEDVPPGEDVPASEDVPTGEDVPPAEDIQPEIEPPPECDPECSYLGHEYCGDDSGCHAIECVSCWKDKDCGEDGFCLNWEFSDGSIAAVCSNECQGDEDCLAGFRCDAASNYCTPKALCPALECTGSGELGNPCVMGDVNADCPPCNDGLFCVGTDPNDSAECTIAKDCLQFGFQVLANPDCVDGACGNSFCTGPCDDNGECPEGFGTFYSGFKCYCQPVGPGAAGDPCPIFNVNLDADECGDKLNCLGIQADEESQSCNTADDCDTSSFLAAADCVDGRCGLSFCSPLCDEGVCEDGFVPINVSGTCYCAPVATGDGEAGDACPVGDINPDADLCGSGTVCLGWGGTEEADPCEAVDDCPLSQWYGNPVCVDGFCGTSFCAPYCDADGKCGIGYFPDDDGVSCLCIPTLEGDSEAGEACPFGDVNVEADHCSHGLTCLGMTPDDPDECETDADCPLNQYWGNPYCLDGECAASFCSPQCDDGECESGFEATLVGDSEKCYCRPIEIGEGEQGDPCPLGYAHPDADPCLEELSCFGFAPDGDQDECEADADCPPSVYWGVGACVDGFCGSSWCAAECDEEGECDAGYASLTTDDDFCFCVPKVIGESEAGEACPAGYGNLDAAGCLADLDCVGIFSDPDEPDACATADDCDAEVYIGTIDCVEEECVSSFCADECSKEGDACEGYFETYIDEGDVCWCAPGDEPPPPACADTCDGCCDGEDCLAGDEAAACGAAGGECIACEETQNCVDGACADKADNGAGCEAEADCLSGFCTDDVCCDAACGGECETCGLAENIGVCTPYDENTDPEGECAAATCVDSTLTPAGACDGAGACAAAEEAPCCPYKCGDAACLDACTGDEDCCDGATCVDDACVVD